MTCLGAQQADKKRIKIYSGLFLYEQFTPKRRIEEFASRAVMRPAVSWKLRLITCSCLSSVSRFTVILGCTEMYNGTFAVWKQSALVPSPPNLQISITYAMLFWK